MTLSSPSRLGTVALLPLALLLATALEAQAQTDRIIFRPGHEVEGLGGGQVRELAIDRVSFERREEERTVRVDPWSIQWIQFGDDRLPPEWQSGLANLRSGSYDQAVSDLDQFFNHNFRDEIRSEDRRVMITWTTHYYLGRAYMGVGSTIERYGERILSDLQDAQTDDNVIYRDLRGRVERQVNQMARMAGNFLDEDFRELQDELSALLQDHSDKSFFASEEFATELRAVARAAARGNYNRAVDVLNHMFVSPPDQNLMAFSESDSMWFFEMKLATAEAMRGAGRYPEALGELHSRLVPRLAEHGDVPSRSASDRIDNPELIERAESLAGREPGYYNYVNRAYNLFAQICIDAGAYPGALEAYQRLQRQFRPRPEFSHFYNEAALNYAFTLSYQHGFTRARDELQEIIDNVGFESYSPDRFEPSYLLDSEEASIVAGAYTAMGDLALREYESTGDSDYRQQALEAYLRVTAFFASDDLRAKALFQASRLYRDIANEWESEWADRPAEDEDGNITNPYHYYHQLSERLRNELQELFPDSEWAAMLT